MLTAVIYREGKPLISIHLPNTTDRWNTIPSWDRMELMRSYSEKYDIDQEDLSLQFIPAIPDPREKELTRKEQFG